MKLHGDEGELLDSFLQIQLGCETEENWHFHC